MPILIYFEEYDPANVQAQMLRGRGTNVHIRKSSIFNANDRENADAVVIMPDVDDKIAKSIIDKYSAMARKIPCYQPKKGEILQADPKTGKINSETIKVSVKSVDGGQGGVPVVTESSETGDGESGQGNESGSGEGGGTALNLDTLPPVETATIEQMRDTLKKMDLAVPPRINDENLRNMYRASIEKARKGE